MRMVRKPGAATMPKGPRGQKLPTDVTGDAVTVARAATGEREETGYRQLARREGGLADAEAGSDVPGQRNDPAPRRPPPKGVGTGDAGD